MRRNKYITGKYKKPPLPEPKKECYIGVDWGGSNHTETVACIIRSDGKISFTNTYTSLFKDQIDFIKELIKNYQPNQVVVDRGFGGVQTQTLQEEFGDKVKSCIYASHEFNPSGRFISYNSQIFMITANREITLAQSSKLASLTTAMDQEGQRHALNYAYIASQIEQASRVSPEGPRYTTEFLGFR